MISFKLQNAKKSTTASPIGFLQMWIKLTFVMTIPHQKQLKICRFCDECLRAIAHCSRNSSEKILVEVPSHFSHSLVRGTGVHEAICATAFWVNKWSDRSLLCPVFGWKKAVMSCGIRPSVSENLMKINAFVILVEVGHEVSSDGHLIVIHFCPSLPTLSCTTFTVKQLEILWQKSRRTSHPNSWVWEIHQNLAI